MLGPASSYSVLVIHIVQKDESDDKIDPPIQTENFLSGGAKTLIFMVVGANLVTSLFNLSGNPVNIVLPPERTMLAYRSLLTSMSHFMIEL